MPNLPEAQNAALNAAPEEISESARIAAEIAEINDTWRRMIRYVEEGELNEACNLADMIMDSITDGLWSDGIYFGPTLLSSDNPNSKFACEAINRVMAISACRLIRALSGEF